MHGHADNLSSAVQWLCVLHYAVTLVLAFNILKILACIDLATKENVIQQRQAFDAGVQAAALCYVPATRNYWVTGQHGNVQAFDPRAPGDVTPFIKATRFPPALLAVVHLVLSPNPRL